MFSPRIAWIGVVAGLGLAAWGVASGLGRAQDEPGQPRTKVTKVDRPAGETLESINDDYNRQLLRLEQQRLERLGQLAASQAISAELGRHQLAQKTTRTALPLRSLRLTGLPSMSVPWIGGAGWPTRLSWLRREAQNSLMAGLLVSSWISRNALRATSSRSPWINRW